MLSTATVIVAGLVWLALMFAAAVYGERHPGAFSRRWRHVYALSLAVHCTSWTFYGTVTQAARYGWPLPPTFLGAILFYLLAFAFMVRLVRLARESNATSLADLIATRLGRDPWLAATVTLVAALGLVPYIALQLKAVTMSFATLTGEARGGADVAPWRDGALYVALAMAVFAMLFGTRRASATEHNRGLVLAIAFESLFKLVAMLVLGLFVWLALDIPAVTVPVAPASAQAGGFVPLVLLGALAMFILPHQFHIGVVECRDERDIRSARWLFPLYLVLIALPTLPLARAGVALLGDAVPSDMYALALPASQGHGGIALFAFLGGLSASTGMVVVSTLALSLMIGNHWFAPGLLRGAWSGQGDDRRGDLLRLRRACIVAIMLLSWSYARLVGGSDALADIGAVSFSALATLAPALAFAVWRPRTPPRAATVGVMVAFMVWAWVMLTPLLAATFGAKADWIAGGPFGWTWLSPDALFGLTGWSRLGRAVGASFFAGTLAMVLLSLQRPRIAGAQTRGFDAQTLRRAATRFLPAMQVDALLADAPRGGAVPARIEERLERELSAVLGAASARLLLDAARREAGADLDTVAAIVGEASQDLRFNQRLLEGALQNMSQGISVVDAQLHLVAWNRRYAELFGFPDALLQVGRPIAEISRWALRHVEGADDVEAALQRRLAHMRAGTPHLSERRFPDGSIVEIRGNPMPGGGFVATFTDVTAFRHAQDELRRSNETLEQRVDERTALLQAAKHEAERANEAKTRFLTAIGHDLLQPLHAAQLFTDALSQQVEGEPRRDALQNKLLQIRGALDSTTDLLTGLLDMSRLEAGGLVPEPRDFPLAEVLDPLASEFAAMAAERGLRFRHVRSGAWTHTDPQLLRRILQNFLANAVSYTARGTVLLGVRRAGDALRIEVHDTGSGIAPELQQAIFEEFRRGDDAAGQGLGLGLSIADRIARLLGAPIALRSAPGSGTTFSLLLPSVQAQRTAAAPQPGARGYPGLRVLVVDNVPAGLQALQAMLERWGCMVSAVADGDAALAAEVLHPADLWLLDYHLDAGDTGVALYQRLVDACGPRPAVILSADHGDQVRRAVMEAGLPLLPKPVKALALKSVMDRALAARPPSTLDAGRPLMA